jgi:transposase
VLVEQVEEHKDVSLAEHAEMLYEATGRRISLMTVQRTLHRLGITRKKDKTAESTR